MSNEGMFEIPLFAIFAILCQIRENSLIWSSLIWSHHCIALFYTLPRIHNHLKSTTMTFQSQPEAAQGRQTEA